MASSNKRPPSTWTTGWTDVLNTGTWRDIHVVHQSRPAPCRGVCPVDAGIPIWVRQVRDGEHHAAWLTLVENNPIPAIIGRICHHPCEGSCNRDEYDGSVSINALEQYLGDLALEHGWALPAPAPESGHRVAVVGGGPAGLSFAYQLRRKGVQVTIFEANAELGGVLRYGIPEYRLPTTVVAAEIRRIIDLGIEVVTCRTIGAREDLEDLETTFDAVFVAPGAHVARWATQFPEDNGRVTDAITFLRKMRSGEPMALGRTVAVIGGGRVAMDVAGSALRLGSRPTLVALERRDAMPAPGGALQEVLDEGALLIDGAMVTHLDDGSGTITLHCVKVELDPGAPAGVVRPTELTGTDFAITADTVILAIGQDPELADWASPLSVSSTAVEVDGRFRTSRPGVFAAGDAAGSERFVATAVGDGMRAADSVARYLDLPRPLGEGAAAEEAEAREVSFSDINTFYFPPIAREERGTVDARTRTADFREIQSGYSAGQAQTESERCFSCGACVECDNCFVFCPDMAIVRESSSALHYRVLDQYCKGCGCCLEECPCGAMSTREETR